MSATLGTSRGSVSTPAARRPPADPIPVQDQQLVSVSRMSMLSSTRTMRTLASSGTRRPAAANGSRPPRRRGAGGRGTRSLARRRRCAPRPSPVHANQGPDQREPQPQPSLARSSPVGAWQRARRSTEMLGRDAHARVADESSASSFSGRTSMSIRPPRRVYLTRWSRGCSPPARAGRRRPSTGTAPRRDGARGDTPCTSAIVCSDSTQRVTSAPSSVGSLRRMTLPEVTRETSSRSSTSRLRCLVCRSIVSACLATQPILDVSADDQVGGEPHRRRAGCAARAPASPETDRATRWRVCLYCRSARAAPRRIAEEGRRCTGQSTTTRSRVLQLAQRAPPKLARRRAEHHDRQIGPGGLRAHELTRAW